MGAEDGTGAGVSDNTSERIARFIMQMHQSWDWLDTKQIADMATIAFVEPVTEAMVDRVLNYAREQRHEAGRRWSP